VKRYQRALITGASRGLGAALARELGRRGYALTLCARNARELEEVANEVRAQHRVTVDCIGKDLSDVESLFKFSRELAANASGIDVLINNAGIGTYKPIGEWSNQEIADCTTVNLTAPMLLSKALLPSMIVNKRGMIVNIASDLSRRPLANMAPYVASKHALLGFSGSLLREVKQHGIKVCSVLPGIIDTAFNGAEEGSKEETWALRPSELASRIADLLELPENVVIDELTIHPLHQDF
jgi:short-subunit dehydrogenase